MKYVYITLGIVALFSISFFTYTTLNKKNSGQVLGASLNYYKDKTIKPVKPPQKIPTAQDPQIFSESAVLISNDGKYVLYEKNARKQMPIASITKTITALVAFDVYKTDEIIEVKEDNIAVEGSAIGLKKGEKISIINLLYGLLMNSGNDAAKTLAGSKVTETDFVKLMNDKAKELGLKDTVFADPAGLNDLGHSTATDVAIIFSNLLKNETLSKIISTSEYEIKSTDGSIVHELKNSNRLVTGEIPFEGAMGGKTGFTYEAGHTLVCAAKKNDIVLVGVILKTDSSSKSASAEESKKLLEWGFDSFIF